jgi:hypothetical protein
MGNQAAVGAVEAIRSAPPPPEGQQRLAERVGQDTATGALSVLSSDQGLERLSKIVEVSVTRSFEAALRAPPSASPAQPGGGPGRVRGRVHARSVVEQLASESASAASDALSIQLQRALGPDGRGPLAESLSATAANVSGAAARGARGELNGLFLGCANGDRACVEAGVRSLGRAAASGFVEGILGSVAWLALLVAFVVGLLVAVAVSGTWRLVGRTRQRRLA